MQATDGMHAGVSLHDDNAPCLIYYRIFVALRQLPGDTDVYLRCLGSQLPAVCMHPASHLSHINPQLPTGHVPLTLPGLLHAAVAGRPWHLACHRAFPARLPATG